jgi:hypothetical protein
MHIVRRIAGQTPAPIMQSAVKWSNSEFYNTFNLEEVARYNSRGDIEAATKVLINHYRKRLKIGWPFPPRTISDMKITIDEICDVKIDQLTMKELIARADSILSNQISDGGVSPKLTPEGVIDWHTNPTTNPEWHWWLHRHHWWPILAKAFAITHNERYAEAFVFQMKDWIYKNPPPRKKDETSPSWRLMEVGLRMRVSWIPSFALFFESKAFTDEDKVIMLRSIYDHASFLSSFKSKMNHLLRESNGLAAVAAYFPEFKEAHQWESLALSRIDQELATQINDDGSHIEVSVGYQWLAVDEFEKAARLLEDCDLSLPHQNLVSQLEKMYQVLVYVVRPDGTFPQINDGFIQWEVSRIAEAGEKLRRQDFVYIGTLGDRGQLPAYDSVCVADAGFFVMRSGWTEQSKYLFFDAGPYGGWHGHEDKLSFEIYALGAPFIVDAGSYTYENTDPYRTYFVGSYSHNTVLVDGLSQIRRWDKSNMKPRRSKGGYAKWITEKDFDYVSADYDEGYAKFGLSVPKQPDVINDVVHRRQIIFVKPDYWIFVDQLFGSKLHDYQLLFHAHPDITVHEMENASVRLENAHTKSFLYLMPALPDGLNVNLVKGSKKPIQGWYSDRPYHRVPTPTIIYEKMKCKTVELITLAYPSSTQQIENVLKIEPIKVTQGDGLACVVSHPSGKDYIMISQIKGLKKFGPFEATGNLSGVRTDHKGEVWDKFEA